MKITPSTTLALCVFLAACADKPDVSPVEKEEAASKPRLVGRIASIPADREFVLIQAYGTWTVETGSVLTSQGPDGRTANLLATGEKLGQYAAADIRTGTLEVGDGVYTIAKIPVQIEEPPEPAVAEKSEAPAEETVD
jgi:hypothetical protein